MMITDSEPSYVIDCGVCGKLVSLNPIEAKYATFRLCDECIKAIKFAKRFMEVNSHILPNLDEDDGK